MKEQQISKRFLIVLIIMMMILTNTINLFAGAAAEQYDSEGEILYFESQSPVYSINVYRDTAFEELRLPDTLRAVMAVTDEEKESFVQALPQPGSDGDYDYYQYGYISPEGAEAIFEAGEPVLYEIHYMDGETAYRVYGSCDEGNSFDFYACDENGNITGIVKEIQVEWDESQYTMELYDEKQYLTPTLPTGVYYDGEVYAQVVVLDEEEDRDIDCDVLIGEVNQDMALALNETAAKTNPPASIGSFADAKALMEITTPTKGNKAGTGVYADGVPGTWVDYVNTTWMNKVQGFSFTTENGVTNGWKWSGGKCKRSGDPSSDPLSYSNYNNGTYYIYSVEQMLNAIGDLPAHGGNTITIMIMKDLDFNGKDKTWTTLYNVGTKANKLIIDGNNHTFYNIKAYNTKNREGSNVDGTFLNFSYNSSQSVEIKNLTFKNVFSMSYSESGGALFGDYTYAKGSATLTNVDIVDSVFYNGGRYYKQDSGFGRHISPFGMLAREGTTITKSSVEGCYIYGGDHVAGLISGGRKQTNISYSFVTDTVICGTGGHSSGFISCNMATGQGLSAQEVAQQTIVSNCFSNIELYGSKSIGGFNCVVDGYYTDCFSTGKIEGYDSIGGFVCQAANASIYTRCYSTALVGLRSDASTLGGFASKVMTYTGYQEDEGPWITDCYAAGEVGNYTTNLNISQAANNSKAGGFTAYTGPKAVFTNCYYDKQTTAMREWVAAGFNTQKGYSIDGIKGVLTTTTAKAGTGLASENSGSSGDEGFNGFSNNSKWAYEKGHYPQIYSLRRPSSAWGDDQTKAKVKANSLVSIAPVFLNTWETGYDWSNKGVRSKDEVSYDRTKEEAAKESYKVGYTTHLGNKYTYDTVREIVTDFQAASGGSFTGMINGSKGAYTDDNIDGKKQGSISIKEQKGTVTRPGVEWFRITFTGHENNIPRSASRPIRLISLMSMDAGEDKNLKVSDRYDHTADAKFTIMDKITDDLVVGVDDDKVWSTSLTQGYPQDKKYYEAATTKSLTSISKNAWVYTEIWQTGYLDDSGNKVSFDSPKSVKVTGPGTNGSTLTTTEQQWLGQLPIGMGGHRGMIFEITYYWMLEDGRYISDSKEITLKPGEYSLNEYSYDESGKLAENALYLGTTSGSPQLADTPGSTSSLENQPRGTHVAAAWKKNPDPSENLDPMSLSIRFKIKFEDKDEDKDEDEDEDKDKDNVILMSDEPVIHNPKAGDKITVTAKYYTYDSQTESDAPGGGYDRIVLSYTPIEIELTYTVKEETLEDGTVMNYLVFDSAATYEYDADKKIDALSITGGEVKIKNGTTSGLNKTELSIADIEFDIDVVLVVPIRYNFSMLKLDGNDDSFLAGVKFGLYRIVPTDGKVPSVKPNELTNAYAAEDVYTDASKTIPLTAEGIVTGSDGKADFYGLSPGAYYYLVETQPLDGYRCYSGMIRLYKDPATGIISMASIDENGKVKDGVFYYKEGSDGTGNIEALPSDKFIRGTLKNYLDVEMPVTGGDGTQWYILLFAMTAVALALAILAYRKLLMDGKQ